MVERTNRVTKLAEERLLAVAERLKERRRPAGAREIPRLPRPLGALRLSFAQERLWFLDRLAPGSVAYNVAAAVRLGGRLSIPVLAAALDEIVRRHEALRTRFAAGPAGPLQVIGDPAPLPLPLADLRALPAGRREAELAALAAAEAARPFDLATGPLLRVTLAAIAERGRDDEHAVLLTMHHIAADAWSMGVLVGELVRLYAAFRAGRPSPLPELPVQYGDFAAWQRGRLSGEALEAELGHWRAALAGAPTVIELPADRPRPALWTTRGGSRSFALPAAAAAGVRELARRSGATLFMVGLAAFAALLHRMTGQGSLLVGSTIANRKRTELEGLVGFFVNTLVLRSDLADGESFGDLLARTRERSLAAYAHQDLPFEKLVETLAPVRDASRPPLVQVVFQVLNEPETAYEVPGLSLAPLGAGTESAKFDLVVNLSEAGEGIGGKCVYNADLFAGTTVERLVAGFARLLAAAVAAPAARVAELPLLSAAEEHQLGVEWGGRAASFALGEPGRRSLHEAFAARAAAAPEATAVVCGSEWLSYGELAARSNRLANHLLARGVAPGGLAGLCLERSLELVVALVGVLKTGCAYVPLDPSYPAERLSWLLADSGMKVLLTRSPLVARLERLLEKGPPLVRLDDEEEAIAAASSAPPRIVSLPRDVAYAIYTSGSTGRPKGVLVEHGQVLRLFAATEEWLGAGAGDVWTLFHSYAFDFSVWELWGALLHGGRLVVVPQAVSRSPVELHGLLQREGVTVLSQTPSAFRQLLWAAEEAREGERGLAALRWVVFGGEALEPAALAGWMARHGDERPRLANLYGITETTVHTTFRRIRREDLGSSASPLGRPLADLSVHLLDRGLAAVPIGVPGEIFVGGAGVARGYLGRPELTAERFVPDPFAGEAGGRLYRSGDLARWGAKGDLLYLGRIDRQVKVRGFRVELGEIQAALERHPAVREAVVLARRGPHEAGDPGEPRLVAYVAADGERAPGAAELRGFLAARLPEHMLPAAYVVLSQLPLTAHGKVDRRALEAFEAPEALGGGGAEARAGALYAVPRDALERFLADLFAASLEVERVGIHDGFFALGGNSIAGAILINRLQQALGEVVQVVVLFDAPSVAELAAHLRREHPRAVARRWGGGAAVPAAGDRREELGRIPASTWAAGQPVQLSFAQERLWFLDQLEPGSPAYNIALAVELAGHLATAALSASLAEIVRRHAVLRTTFAVAARRPAQVIAPARDLALPQVDLSGLPPAARDALGRRLAGGDARRPFDLARGPLVRSTLLRLEAERHIVLFALHHIVADGWSMGVLAREVGALYAAAVAGLPSPLPEPAIQYADFAVWQRGWLAGAELERQLGFWRERLAGAPDALDLKTDRPRPAVQRYRGASLPFTLPAPLAAALGEISLARGTTLYMTLLAGFAALLSRLSGQRDLVVGSMIANRNRAELEGLIGFFVNTLALRIGLEEEPSFVALLARVRESALGAFGHQDLPFEMLVEELRLPRETSRSPLFQVVFQMQNAPPPHLSLPGLELRPVGMAAEAAKFDLAANVYERGRELAGVLTYSTDLFDRTTAARLAAGFEVLLTAAAADPERPFADLPLLGVGERHQVLFEWSAGDEAPAPRATVADLFVREAGRRPEAVAIETAGEMAGKTADGALTYGALAARAGGLARALRRAGVGPDAVVGLCLPRSAELVVAALAVILAGGAYLPLDAELPAERLAFMAGDAGAVAVLTDEASLGRLAAVLHAGRLPVLTLEALALEGAAEASPPPDLDPDHLAYVMYTSGSTGRPKGVAVTHRGVVRLVAGAIDFGPRRVGLALAPFSFDASTAEIWGALANGSRLVVPRPGVLSPEEIADLVAQHGITVLWLTAGLFHQMVEQVIDRAPQRLASLARLVVGGDVLSPSLTARAIAALPGTLVIAGYGPTENTTFTCCAPLAEPAAIGAQVPLGRPIAGTRAVLLSIASMAAGGPAPIGAVGELYAGGAGLARGYAGRPELTAAAFLPDAESGALAAPGARLYRTGDLARHRADGRLEFLGRADRQLKLRGIRIEPGEIEAALASHPGVRQAAVLSRRRRGDLRLTAYVEVAAREGSPAAGAAELRAHLRLSLPEPMVPAHIVILAALPLTANGKLDRAALARLPVAEPPRGAAAAAPRTPPRNPSEELLAAIWSEVLGIETIAVEDDFFALSGHSLLATQVAFRVREAFGVELPLVRLFERVTLGELAAAIDAAGEGRAGVPPAPPIVPAPRGEPIPASFLQEWALELQGGPVSAAMNMPFALRLSGPLDLAVVRRALAEIWRRHEVLRATFRVERGELVQVIGPVPGTAGAAALVLPVIDLAGLPAALREALVHELAAEDARRPFDVRRGPLLSLRVLRLGAAEHAILFNMHHAIGDGWSIEVFQGELTALYGAFLRGEPSPLPRLPLQFGDFAWWQRRSFAGPALAAQLAYWHRLLADRPPVVDLPADRPRPEVLGSATVGGGFELRGPALAALRAAARAAGCTVSMALLAALQALLHRYTGEEDILVGTIVSGRHRRELAPLIGMFMNSVTLRTDLSGAPSFAEAMQRVRAVVLDAYRHQDVPFPALLASLFPGQALHRTLMFRTAFNMENFSAAMPETKREPDREAGFPGLTATSFGEGEAPAKYDLLVGGREEADRILCHLIGAADLFDPATLTAICEDYEELIVQAAGDPEIRLDRLLPSPRHRLAAGARERQLRGDPPSRPATAAR